MENLSLKVTVVEIERFEELQRYDPIRRHVVDSRPESRKSKMTEPWRAEQELEETRDSVLEVKRRGGLGVTNKSESRQEVERSQGVPHGDDVAQNEDPEGYKMAGWCRRQRCDQSGGGEIDVAGPSRHWEQSTEAFQVFMGERNDQGTELVRELGQEGTNQTRSERLGYEDMGCRGGCRRGGPVAGTSTMPLVSDIDQGTLLGMDCFSRAR